LTLVNMDKGKGRGQLVNVAVNKGPAGHQVRRCRRTQLTPSTFFPWWAPPEVVHPVSARLGTFISMQKQQKGAVDGPWRQGAFQVV